MRTLPTTPDLTGLAQVIRADHEIVAIAIDDNRPDTHTAALEICGGLGRVTLWWDVTDASDPGWAWRISYDNGAEESGALVDPDISDLLECIDY